MLSDYKVVISDLGGVFIDCLSAFKTCSDLLHIDYDEFMAFFFSDLEAPLSDGFMSEEGFWKKVEDKFNVKVDGNILTENFHPVMIEPLHKLYKELQAKGLRVVTGSNNFDGHWGVSLKLHQLDDFDALYASHLMHCHKPNKEFYEYIVKAEGVRPEECIFIDDMSRNLEVPKQMGMKTFLFNLSDPENMTKLEEFFKNI